MPKVPFWVFIIIAAVYFTAIRVDTMDIDASQYAEISREMMQTGSYLQIYDRGLDYLDKPPFLFWVSAAGMKIFGAGNLGYKLPSILFALLALYATYRLARLFYGEATGRTAALVLATCQGMFLMTNDIRCDTILMAWVITAVWLIQEWLGNQRLLYLLGSCAAVAFGMMTKGPIAFMVPVFCFGSDWVLKRRWRNFLRPGYLLGFLLIAVLLIPMSVGLYQQFDLHPEKLVNGHRNVSGLRFFFWTQSFGRITGENDWKNAVDITFLLQNMLWSFLPWIFLLLPALALNTIQLVKQKLRLQPGQEWVSTGGFLLTYLALGSSSYQLPHYIFVAFPLAAIVVARLLHQLIEEGQYKTLYKFMKPFHTVISVLLLVVVLAFITFAFPAPVPVVAVWAAGVIGWIYLAIRKPLQGKLLWSSVVAIVIANLFLTNHVYATLLHYQVGSEVGRYIHDHNIPGSAIAIHKLEDPVNSIQFYAQDTLHPLDTTQAIRDQYILTMDKGLSEIKVQGYNYTILKQGRFFKVSELTPDFINPATRDKVTKQYYFIKVAVK